jgi:sec-independent protein translocase protein TatA
MGLDNPLHIAFLVVVLLLLFGARRLPEIGRSLGTGMREFKQSLTGELSSQQPALGPPQQAPAQPPAQTSVPLQAPAPPAPEQATAAAPTGAGEAPQQ